jgi:hypothetical protein
MPMSSRVSPAQVYSRGHQRARSVKAANAWSAGTPTVTDWRMGSSAGRWAITPPVGYSAGRSWTAQPLPSGSAKKTKEFQRPPGPSTSSAPS